MVAQPDGARTSELVDSLVQLSFAVRDVLVRASAEHDLSLVQLRLLGILRDRTPAMTAIAVHLGLDRSSVTGLVERAERRGLVSRTTSTRDARVTMVSITPTGRDLGRQVRAMVTAEIETLVAQVPNSERDCIVRVARSVLDAEVEQKRIARTAQRHPSPAPGLGAAAGPGAPHLPEGEAVVGGHP